MAQATGANAQTLIDFETAYGTAPDPVAAINLPFNSNTIQRTRSKNQAATLRGDRNPASPFDGNTDVAGDLVVPVDVNNFGWLFTAMLDDPTTTQDASQTIDNDDAVNVGDGVVGIPVTGHGYETGQSITIAGTVNYNGTHTVLSSSTTNQIDITETFVAETFDGDETVQANLYTHVWKIGDTMPSLLIEKGFTDTDDYFKFSGCRVSRFALEVGGDGELTATLSVAGQTEDTDTSAMDADPTSLSFLRLQNFHASIEEGGASLSNATSMTLDVDFGLDTSQYVIGGEGQRGDLPVGIVGVGGRLVTLFEDQTLITKAINSTESSLKLVLSHPNDYCSLTMELNELQYALASPPIDGPQGILAELDYQAYYDDDADESALVVTLVNETSSYEANPA